MSVATLRKGWCPGALRPMQSGDGYLVRLRMTGGVLSAQNALAIARLAKDHGNGLIDLSGRANLQLRGVAENSLPTVADTLAELGLLDESPEAESVRNVIASPLAGYDPDAVFDIAAIVAGLERRLVDDQALHALPAKFGFLVDDGGTLSLSDISADIRFTAVHDVDTPAFAVSLATDRNAALVSPDEVGDIAARLALAFLKLAAGQSEAPRRMATLVAQIGTDAIFRAAGLEAKLTLPSAAPPNTPLGFHTLGQSGWLGLAMPFGRWTSDTLTALARAALSHGVHELRLTPWRAILLPGIGREAAENILADMPDCISDPVDPRLSVAACPGSPACTNATTTTHHDALALAGVAQKLGRAGVALHVSGCEKGCARPSATAATLVGRDGFYDLVLSGRASDRPMMSTLDLAGCRNALAELARAKGDVQ